MLGSSSALQTARVWRRRLSAAQQPIFVYCSALLMALNSKRLSSDVGVTSFKSSAVQTFPSVSFIRQTNRFMASETI